MLQVLSDKISDKFYRGHKPIRVIYLSLLFNMQTKTSMYIFSLVARRAQHIELKNMHCLLGLIHGFPGYLFKCKHTDQNSSHMQKKVSDKIKQFTD